MVQAEINMVYARASDLDYRRLNYLGIHERGEMGGFPNARSIVGVKTLSD